MDLDALEEAINVAEWAAVESIIEATGKLSFNHDRNALVVEGCRFGSIAAILPGRRIGNWRCGWPIVPPLLRRGEL